MTPGSTDRQTSDADVPDVVVLGGGPAGALTAGLLARAGRRVVIVERDVFPRFHVGESMLPQSLEVLARAGLLDRVRAAGFPRKDGAVFVSGDGARSARFDFAEGDPGSTHPHAFQVDRAAFDGLLLDWAREQGALVRCGQAAAGVVPRDDGGLVAVSVGDDTLHARYLVDAAGLDSPVARLEPWAVAPLVKDRVALFGHFRLAAPAVSAVDVARPGDIVIVEDADTWCWFIPLRGDVTSVGVVLPIGDLPDGLAGESTDRFGALTDRLPVARRALRDAVPCGPVRGVRSYGRATGRLHHRGIVLVGDAAGFLDPVFSSGLCLALASAERLAIALDTCLSDPGRETVHLDDYESFVRCGIAAIRPFVEQWYSSAFRRVIFHPDGDAGVRRRITSVLAGELWRPDNPFVAAGARWIAVLDQARHLSRGGAAPTGADGSSESDGSEGSAT